MVNKEIVTDTYIFDGNNSWFIDGDGYFFKDASGTYVIQGYEKDFYGYTSTGGIGGHGYDYVEGETLW